MRPGWTRAGGRPTERGRGRRGHALLMVMLIGSAMLASGLILTNRVDGDVQRRHGDDVRLEAFWLARSALTARVTGSRDVDTPLGRATITVSEGSATVTLEGATATVQESPWVERYDAR